MVASPRQTQYEYCRICEDKLKSDDDPFWGLCETCLTERRAFWQKAYDRIEEPEPGPTGDVKYPNRLA